MDILNIRDRMKEVNPGLTDAELDRIENDVRYYKGIANKALNDTGLATSKTEEVIPERMLWTVIIPEFDNYGRIFPKHHVDVWINKVMEISTGVTVYRDIIGKYISTTNGLMSDVNLAVMFMATEDEVNELAQLAKTHFDQESIMYYMSSNNVKFI